MTQDFVAEFAQRVVELVLALASPMLLAGLVVGLVIAVFQAATQIQESSLAFVPKLVAVGLALVVAGPWCLDRIVYFTQEVMEEIVYIGVKDSDLP